MEPVCFTLNGKSVALTPESPGETLLDAIRAYGLTSAKEGCAEGECGACTVMLVGRIGERTAYRAINSCLMLLPMAADHEVVTCEALAEQGVLSEAQQAMAAAGGSQCGYCTPGFVMSLTAEQYRPGRSGPCDTMALAGNLCRCTGYRPIGDAARALSLPPPPDAAGPDSPSVLRRLATAPPTLQQVSSESFSRPTRLADCVRLLADHPEARVVAGASDLGVESNLHGRRFPHLVSVEAIEELHEFTRTSGGRLRVGAALPLSELGERWHDAPAAVTEWLALFASPPIRNRATLGGNLATASPIGDAAPLLLALDARIHLAGGEVMTRRTVELQAFFTGYRQTLLQPGELITTIELPQPLPKALRFYKVAKRRLDDISTVAAAMAIDINEGRVGRARFCFGGVAATPIRLIEAEQAVVGTRWDASAVERVQGIIERTVTPLSDHRGSSEYRLAVSRSLVEKFFVETTQ